MDNNTDDKAIASRTSGTTTPNLWRADESPKRMVDGREGPPLCHGCARKPTYVMKEGGMLLHPKALTTYTPAPRVCEAARKRKSTFDLRLRALVLRSLPAACSAAAGIPKESHGCGGVGGGHAPCVSKLCADGPPLQTCPPYASRVGRVSPRRKGRRRHASRMGRVSLPLSPGRRHASRMGRVFPPFDRARQASLMGRMSPSFCLGTRINLRIALDSPSCAPELRHPLRQGARPMWDTPLSYTGPLLSHQGQDSGEEPP